ncbi:hypothetical protein AcV5_008905 [Taiwanofungus camphoratus]|nr:hypothetical protein AcV5_008905 [Antrodia cinnamomea]
MVGCRNDIRQKTWIRLAFTYRRGCNDFIRNRPSGLRLGPKEVVIRRKGLEGAEITPSPVRLPFELSHNRWQPFVGLENIADFGPFKTRMRCIDRKFLCEKLETFAFWPHEENAAHIENEVNIAADFVIILEKSTILTESWNSA